MFVKIIIMCMFFLSAGCGGVSNSRFPAKVENEGRPPKKDGRPPAKSRDTNSSAANLLYILKNTTAISRQGTSGSTQKDDLSRPGPQKSTITNSPSSGSHDSDGHKH